MAHGLLPNRHECDRLHSEPEGRRLHQSDCGSSEPLGAAAFWPDGQCGRRLPAVVCWGAGLPAGLDLRNRRRFPPPLAASALGQPPLVGGVPPACWWPVGLVRFSHLARSFLVPSSRSSLLFSSLILSPRHSRLRWTSSLFRRVPAPRCCIFLTDTSGCFPGGRIEHRHSSQLCRVYSQGMRRLIRCCAVRLLGE